MASVVLFIAATSTLAWASRMKAIPRLGVAHHTMANSIIHTPFSLPHPKMQVPLPQDDAFDDFLVSNASWLTVPTKWRNIISHQMLPPTTIYRIDVIHLLQEWADSSASIFEESVAAASRTNQPLPQKDEHHSLKTSQDAQGDKAVVLHKMCDALAEATNIFTQPHTMLTRIGTYAYRHLLLGLTSKKLEMVGLITKASIASLSDPEGLSNEDDAFVLAAGVFSRGRLKDNSGSLRKAIWAKHKHEVSRVDWEQGATEKGFVDVFAIEGLAAGPDVDMHSARTLLRKVEKYASIEQRFIVMPMHALISSDGSDLTDYYVRLGFDKVQLKGELHELVYTGAACLAADAWEDEETVMVGMNLWTGV